MSLEPYDRCLSCKLLGHDALRGEQAVVGAGETIQVWRHPVCGHVQMWRAGGTLEEPRREVDAAGRLVVGLGVPAHGDSGEPSTGAFTQSVPDETR